MKHVKHRTTGNAVSRSTVMSGKSTLNTLRALPAMAALVACAAGTGATADTVQQTAPPSLASPRAPSAREGKVRQIEWDALLPERERANFRDAAPPPIHDYLGEGGKAVRQSGSTAVNTQLDELRVKIPGFIVPLVENSKGMVTEFFLVPYLGACIHVPPPPPNQIVYVKLTGDGVRFPSLEEAYWVIGTMHTQSNGTRVATAAYTIEASRVQAYVY